MSLTVTWNVSEQRVVVRVCAWWCNADTSLDRGIEFRRAFDQALLNANDTQLEMPTCPTGNCHWPIFSTLGMCGSCQDQTSNIQIQCGLTLMSSKALQPWNWTYCAYTYADGDQLYTPREGSDEFGRDYNFDALPVVANYSRARENVGLTIKTPTVRVFLVSAGNTFSDSNTGYYTFRIHDNTYRLRPGPTIHDCKFVWCIQAYNVSVSKGTQTTHKLGQWTDFTQSGDGRDRVLHFNMTNIPSAIIDSIHSGHRNWTVPRIQGDTPTKSVYAETKLYDEPPHDPSNLTFSEFRAVSMYRITDYSAWIENAASHQRNAAYRRDRFHGASLRGHSFHTRAILRHPLLVAHVPRRAHRTVHATARTHHLDYTRIASRALEERRSGTALH